MGTQTFVKVGLLAFLLLSICVGYWFASSGRKPPAWMTALLGVAAGVAVLSFFQFGTFVRGHFLNYHDLFVYYLGSKYADEVGYQRLYHCSLIALDESDPQWHANINKVRSLVHYGHVDKTWYLDRPRMCKRRFTAERWEAFRHDISTYRGELKPSLRGRLADKGYNATPVGTMIAKPLSSLVPLQPDWLVNLLGAIDLALLAAAHALVARAFGWRALAFSAIYLGACYELAEPHIRGGFLRLDWLACLIAAPALVQLGRRFAGGAVLAYATAVRLFPALFLFGPVLHIARDLLDRQHRRSPDLRLMVGFCATLAILGGASIWAGDGLARWQGFRQKIQLHDADISPMRVGLKYVLLYRGEQSRDDYVGTDGRKGYRPHFLEAKQELHRKLRIPRVLFAAALVALLGFLATRLEEAEAMAVSFPLVFLFTSPTFYYYSFLAAVIPVLAGRLDRPRSAALLGSIVLTSLFVHVANAAVDFQLRAHFFYSTGMLALVLVTVAVLAWDRHAVRSAGLRSP